MKPKNTKHTMTRLGIAAGAMLSFAVAGAHANASDQATAGNAEDGTGRMHASETEPLPSEPDNSGRNVRDEAGKTLTPMDQSNEPADVELTQKIRKGHHLERRHVHSTRGTSRSSRKAGSSRSAVR